MASNVLSKLTVFESACSEGYGIARAHAAEGGKVAGYVCSYSPRELLHAAGYFPVRVMGRLGGTPRADALMQAFICSFARSTFDAALMGELDFLEVALFAHTCDTMQNLADLWQGHCPKMKTIITSLPNVHAGPAAAYLRKDLERVRGEVEAAAGKKIRDASLLKSIKVHEQHRAAMRSLYELRRLHPALLTGTQMMGVVLSSFLMPVEDHLKQVNALVKALQGAAETSAAPKAGLKVVVGGSVCQAVDFVAAIEAAGCLVANDDLCMGSRSFAAAPLDGEDPMDLLTQRYLGRVPCPAVHKPGFDPGARMIERVQESGADGVIFLITKFCDPYLFDYPHVHEQLEKAGIPSLMLEVEQHLPVPEQLRTRVEAFAEILQSKKDMQ